MFKINNFIGAIGGRPNAAFYFVGTHDDDILYLDPHKTQTSVGIIDKYASLASYSPRGLDRMGIMGADPSMCIGFYCHTHRHFTDVVADIKKVHLLVSGDKMWTHRTPWFQTVGHPNAGVSAIVFG
eukprot:m.204900 g.204900  ORF g.204900 m.204900 type:complete len:126 (+) comp18871_c0_seq79:950-1327(+)